MDVLTRFFDRLRLKNPISKPQAVLVAVGCVVGAAGGRLVLEQVVPGVLPFLFTFPAVIAATLLGGALAGWVALAGCQLLTLAFVLPHWVRTNGVRPEEITNLFLATFSLAIVVWATAAYRAAERGWRRQCEREVVTLSLMANEADHRTKNNFQIAASLLHSQSLSADGAARTELQTAAGRLVSIAAIYGNLSARQPESGMVPLLEYLEQISEGVRAGLLPPGVSLITGGDAVTVPATTALTIGLVVNEWITNAIKYAFPDRGGRIRIDLARHDDMIHVDVRDDGVGLSAEQVTGTGSRLLTSLVETMDGHLGRRNEGGTVCTLAVPMTEKYLNPD